MPGGKVRLSVPKKGTFPAVFKEIMWMVSIPKSLEEAKKSRL